MRVASTPRLLTHELFPFEGRRPLVDLAKLKRVEFDDGLSFWLTAPGNSFDLAYHALIALFEHRALVVERTILTGALDQSFELAPDLFGFKPVEFFRVVRVFSPSPGFSKEVQEKQGKILLYKDAEDMPSLLVCVPRFMEARRTMEDALSIVLNPLRFDSIPLYS